MKTDFDKNIKIDKNIKKEKNIKMDKNMQAFKGVEKLDFNKAITFFVGENGSVYQIQGL